MTYCMTCGTKLEAKFLENEGEIPYCSSCQAFRFPMFNAAVSMIILNPSKDKVLLIQQYQRKDNILVAGYINRGENAESAVIREVFEETGLIVSQVQANQTQFFEPSNTLMMNYVCVATTETIRLTDEVDLANWFELEVARDMIKPDSLAQSFLEAYLMAGVD